VGIPPEGDLHFGNEDNDTINDGIGNDTLLGGIGNDSLDPNEGRDAVQGNEGNDTIAGSSGLDTISGGTGADQFRYGMPAGDGNNADGGGPVEFITDVNWAEDQFFTGTQTVTFTTSAGAGTGANLAAAANNAIGAAFGLAGSTGWVAAQFTFGGRTYLAVDQTNAGAFVDADDLLIDITGVTGTIGNGNFV
jgi:Ca2+-binding RTX toxin-like protein